MRHSQAANPRKSPRSRTEGFAGGRVRPVRRDPFRHELTEPLPRDSTIGEEGRWDSRQRTRASARRRAGCRDEPDARWRSAKPQSNVTSRRNWPRLPLRYPDPGTRRNPASSVIGKQIVIIVGEPDARQVPEASRSTARSTTSNTPLRRSRLTYGVELERSRRSNGNVNGLEEADAAVQGLHRTRSSKATSNGPATTTTTSKSTTSRRA